VLAVVVYARHVRLKPTKALRDGMLCYPTEHLFL
jgi:hypothetical protein